MLRAQDYRAVGSLGVGWGPLPPKQFPLWPLSILMNFLLIFWPSTGSEENISWLLQIHFCLLNQNSRSYYYSKVTILWIKACVLMIFFFSLRPKSKFWIFSLRKGRKETGTEMARVLVLPCYVQVGIHNKRQQLLLQTEFWSEFWSEYWLKFWSDSDWNYWRIPRPSAFTDKILNRIIEG